MNSASLAKMEGSSSVEGNQKLPKRKKMINDEDTMSKLPEPLISRILSFLPTKDAVRTSVLSKKWLFCWTFITRLDLDDTDFYSLKKKTGGKMSFHNFVYRALLHTQTSTFESFSILLANEYDMSLLNTWIPNILTRSRNLRVETHSKMSFSALASHSLFDSMLLEEVVLKMDSCAIRVPKIFARFASLKLLKLSGILFTLHSSSKVLTLSFPLLKVFETVNCRWLNGNRLHLIVPLLERVVIVEDAVSMSNETSVLAIYFSRFSMKQFSYCGLANISYYFKLLDSSSAHNASVNVVVKQCPTNRVTVTKTRAFVLLNEFRQMKCVEFEGCEVLAQSKVVAKLPSFEMLSHLKLGLVSGEVLLGLLLKSPILKTLHFKGVSTFDTQVLNSVAVPDCLTSTLQVVKFDKLHGCEHELCLAKYFMENGLVLERISFYLVSLWLGKSKIMEKFKEKLFSFKKGFSFAIIEFSYDV
ncbi:hypothetical protein V8G54_027645 [Vigna mungo]|uniref:F-box domain-containing protein n=1 Tax=Vigna mungo TaxID=3915 RepID=A0AAQ3RRL4_VIGMU